MNTRIRAQSPMRESKLKPAIDPSVDYKALVQSSYDRCAAVYSEARMEDVHPEVKLLGELLDDGASVLDIGCGAGVPIARTLAERFTVTGIDISSEMILRAQSNVPEASFVHGDIMSMEFPDSSFDAVVAFYSIFHLPREEHAALFRRVHNWLKPGGYLMCTLNHSSESAYTEDDFFGVTMYWSNYGLRDYLEMLSGLGFSILRATSIGDGYSEGHDLPAEDHPLVFARKE